MSIRDTLQRWLELKDCLASCRKVLLVTHDNPDPDSVASAAAFTLLLKSIDRDVKTASGGEISRSENRALLNSIDFKIHSLHYLDLSPFDFFLFLDSQPGSGNNSCTLPPRARYGIVDHHILGTEWPHQPVFTDIRENYGATATIAWEYLGARNLRADSSLATALYYAIRTETSDMGLGAAKADRKAYLSLHTKIDWDQLHQIVHSRVPADYFRMMKVAAEGATRYEKALVVDLGETSHSDSIAEVADTFMRLEGIDWVLCWGWNRDKVMFSLRNGTVQQHAGRLARKMVGDAGSAGGHAHMAGGQLPVGEIPLAETRLRFRRTMIPEFLETIGVHNRDGMPLMELA
ncbi:MAG: DHH family phosphoesterase [Calditrichaeota bacterium]|nr:DHH family phosphoesterase [Candidatus Cloacimonadota bacterium]MCA9786586.1 DHH family phosphoesterase [Candidatus Cloacimonadota bacterium]MCB1047237.1 DHH family phosphoesterase [Calditrichota bacterium]MCB9474140.1 DHH family phosphoesterase [Candidatus Delongbacteria bacterium]